MRYSHLLSYGMPILVVFVASFLPYLRGRIHFFLSIKNVFFTLLNLEEWKLDIVDVVAVDWTAVRACWKISQFFENNFLLRKFAENLMGAFKCPFN